MARKHFLRAAVRPGHLVEYREVVSKVLDDNGVVHGMVAGGAEAEEAQDGVPRMPNFAVNEEKPAAVRGSKCGPGA